jgi:hypothetical protein
MTIMIGIKRQELTLVQADECIPLCHNFSARFDARCGILPW